MNILLATPMPPQPEATGATPLVLHAELVGLLGRHVVTLVTVAGQEPGEQEAVDRLIREGVDVQAVRRTTPTGLARWQRRWRMGSAWLRGYYPWRTVWFWEPQYRSSSTACCPAGSMTFDRGRQRHGHLHLSTWDAVVVQRARGAPASSAGLVLLEAESLIPEADVELLFAELDWMRWRPTSRTWAKIRPGTGFHPARCRRHQVAGSDVEGRITQTLRDRTAGALQSGSGSGERNLLWELRPPT
jgi:hypothetical protein